MILPASTVLCNDANDFELIDFLCPNNAAPVENQNNDEDLCNDIFKLLTDNIEKCNYFDVNQKPIDRGTKNSLHLLHANVTLLQKKKISTSCISLIFCAFLKPASKTKHWSI